MHARKNQYADSLCKSDKMSRYSGTCSIVDLGRSASIAPNARENLLLNHAFILKNCRFTEQKPVD